VDDDVEAELERPLHPGLAKVLSAAQRMPRERQISAIAFRSARRSSGLVGVSTQTSFVSGRERGLQAHRVGEVDEAEAVPRARLPHPFEQRKVPP
jgi:hypothetical protein